MNLKRTVAFFAQQSFFFRGGTSGFILRDCIYTVWNENGCKNYRKMAEMQCMVLHFTVKSIKV